MAGAEDNRWVYANVERLLYVHRGVNIILCSSYQITGELVFLMSRQERDKLRAELDAMAKGS